jgi:hypothetical protein
MKRAIVIILIMILVAGGGAGGLIMLGIVPNPFNPKVPEKPLTAAERAAMELAEKNRFKPPSSALVLVKMDDMVVPVIMNGRSERRVVLIARLVVSSKANEEYVKLNMNRFQDAVLNDLVPYFQDYFLDHDMVNAQGMKERLRTHAKAVYGDRVSDVLLINVFEQGSGRLQ